MLSSITSLFKRTGTPEPEQSESSKLNDLISQIKSLTLKEKEIIKKALETDSIDVVTEATPESTALETDLSKDPNYEYSNGTYKRRRD